MPDQEDPAITVAENRMTVIRTELTRAKPHIARVAPSHIDGNSLMASADLAILQNPAIMDCDPHSIARAVYQAAAVGIVPDGTLGQGWLVPFETDGVKLCQFIPGYRGLISLVRRGGEILRIEAHPVYEHDHFKVIRGTHPAIEHEPDYGATTERDDGTLDGILAFYCIAWYRNEEGAQFEVMSIQQIERIRKAAASKKGPWKTHPVEQGRKTALKRLWKWLPSSREDRAARMLEEALDAGEHYTVEDLAPAGPETSTAERLQARIQTPAATDPDEGSEQMSQDPPESAALRADAGPGPGDADGLGDSAAGVGGPQDIDSGANHGEIPPSDEAPPAAHPGATFEKGLQYAGDPPIVDGCDRDWWADSWLPYFDETLKGMGATPAQAKRFLGVTRADAIADAALHWHRWHRANVAEEITGAITGAEVSALAEAVKEANA